MSSKAKKKRGSVCVLGHFTAFYHDLAVNVSRAPGRHLFSEIRLRPILLLFSVACHTSILLMAVSEKKKKKAKLCSIMSQHV